MIADPMGIVAVLLVIEGAILYAADLPRLRGFFRYVPSMFWIYFLPMLANTVGLIPPERDAADRVITPAYDTITTYCLPAALVLLLMHVDLRRIWRLGPVALAMMLAGGLGILAGGPVVALVFGRWLPADIWTGLGPLAGSWTGGSSNLIAVARSVETPPGILGLVIVVDTIVPYAWMGVLVLLSAHQARFDRWTGARGAILEEVRQRAAEGVQDSRPLTLRHAVVIFGIAAAGTYAAIRLGAALPVVERTVSAATWTILLATTLGLALSFTPARRLERFGASTVGYGLLYFVLASIGAKTSLGKLGGAPVLLAAGAVWVLIHAAFLVTAARLLRAPMALAAAASQANIGGTASAPVVAGVYQPGLAPVGLLLAVLGNILGTYLGLACAAVCRFIRPG